MNNKIVYFPGCTPKSSVANQYKATKKIFEKLDLTVFEPEEFSCCGGSHLEDVNEFCTLLLNARNLAYAEQFSDTLVTGCSTCYYELSKAYFELTNSHTRNIVNKHLKDVDAPLYNGTLRIFHTLNFLCSDEILPLLKLKIHPESGNVNIMPFYGCHILRPTKYHVDDPKGKLDSLLEMCGFNVVKQDEEFSCCGFHSTITALNVSKKLCKNIVDEAATKKSSIIATCCPLCFNNINTNKKISSNKRKVKIFQFEEILNDFIN